MLRRLYCLLVGAHEWPSGQMRCYVCGERRPLRRRIRTVFDIVPQHKRLDLRKRVP